MLFSGGFFLTNGLVSDKANTCGKVEIYGRVAACKDMWQFSFPGGCHLPYNSEHPVPAIALYSLDKTYYNHYEDNKKRLALLKRDLSQLTTSRSELQTEVGSLQQKLGGLEQELAQAKAELQQLKQRKLDPTPKAKASVL